MPRMPLSPETALLVSILFEPELVSEAVSLLEERCGTNLPFLSGLDSRQLERYRFAALKLSEGNLSKLQSAIALAQLDWRDLLVNAEFADDVIAHERWSRDVIRVNGPAT